MRFITNLAHFNAGKGSQTGAVSPRQNVWDLDDNAPTINHCKPHTLGAARQFESDNRECRIKRAHLTRLFGCQPFLRLPPTNRAPFRPNHHKAAKATRPDTGEQSASTCLVHSADRSGKVAEDSMVQSIMVS